MAARPKKQVLFAELVALLTSDLETALRAERAAQEAATHEEAKPENDKDTRALEQSYLARGQSKRTEELRVGLGQTEAIAAKLPPKGGPIALGTLVEAEEEGDAIWFLMAPARGGTKLGASVQVVTPSSPLGRALLGKHEGDDVDVAVAKGTRALSIVRVD
jgi:transcription elongation GreA/GreB family factor